MIHHIFHFYRLSYLLKGVHLMQGFAVASSNEILDEKGSPLATEIFLVSEDLWILVLSSLLDVFKFSLQLR